MSTTPEGWYPDPEQGGQQRYWDGQQWTDHRAPYAQPQQSPYVGMLVKRRRDPVRAVIIGVLVLAGLGSCVALVSSTGDGGSTTSTISDDAVMPDDAEPAPKETPTFKAKVTNTVVRNPATLTVFALVTNTSDVAGSPSCFVYVSDPSGAYKGFDSYEVESIRPGRKQLMRADLTVTNEGAIWATDVSVECEAAE